MKTVDLADTHLETVSTSDTLEGDIARNELAGAINSAAEEKLMAIATEREILQEEIDFLDKEITGLMVEVAALQDAARVKKEAEIEQNRPKASLTEMLIEQPLQTIKDESEGALRTGFVSGSDEMVVVVGDS